MVSNIRHQHRCTTEFEITFEITYSDVDDFMLMTFDDLRIGHQHLEAVSDSL